VRSGGAYRDRPRRRSAAEEDKGKAAASASKINEEYTAKIKEYTTEKYFLTDWSTSAASDKALRPTRSSVTSLARQQAHLHEDMYRLLS